MMAVGIAMRDVIKTVELAPSHPEVGVRHSHLTGLHCSEELY